LLRHHGRPSVLDIVAHVDSEDEVAAWKRSSRALDRGAVRAPTLLTARATLLLAPLRRQGRVVQRHLVEVPHMLVVVPGVYVDARASVTSQTILHAHLGQAHLLLAHHYSTNIIITKVFIYLNILDSHFISSPGLMETFVRSKYCHPVGVFKQVLCCRLVDCISGEFAEPSASFLT